MYNMSLRQALATIQVILVTALLLLTRICNGFSHVTHRRALTNVKKSSNMKASKNNDTLDIPVSTQKLKLSSGVEAEFMTASPKLSLSIKKKPPLLFIHGSFHASWCWAEYYMPYFASIGYQSYALSLRGTEGTFAGEGISKVKISEHVNDIEAFLSDYFAQQMGGAKPVVISHSFGGLAIMKLLEKDPTRG